MSLCLGLTKFLPVQQLGTWYSPAWHTRTTLPLSHLARVSSPERHPPPTGHPHPAFFSHNDFHNPALLQVYFI